MNSRGLTKENLMATLPVALQKDEAAIALAGAVATALSERTEEIDLIRIYPEIDKLDDQLLDILAEDFKIDWWDPNYPVEVKRALFRDNWRVHRLLGTPEAVNIIIRAVFGEGRIAEWFEYGGEPHHFRVEAGNMGMVSDDWITYFMRLLKPVKRLTSWMDGITVSARPAEDMVHMGLAAASTSRLFVPC